MESLGDILKQKKLRVPSELSSITKRLTIYIEKKYDFHPKIHLTAQRKLAIYAPTAAQATVLRLDWANLHQLVNQAYEIRIYIRKTSRY